METMDKEVYKIKKDGMTRAGETKENKLMKKEVRIPILGVIEESETLTGNERYFLDHYPHGEGAYLVKIGSCYKELRDVHIRNEKTPNDRIKCDF